MTLTKETRKGNFDFARGRLDDDGEKKAAFINKKIKNKKRRLKLYRIAAFERNMNTRSRGKNGQRRKWNKEREFYMCRDIESFFFPPSTKNIPNN